MTLGKKNKKDKLDKVDKLISIIEECNDRNNNLVQHIKSLEDYVDHLEHMLFGEDFQQMEGMIIPVEDIENIPEFFKSKMQDKFPKTKTYTIEQILESLESKKKNKDK